MILYNVFKHQRMAYMLMWEKGKLFIFIIFIVHVEIMLFIVNFASYANSVYCSKTD